MADRCETCYWWNDGPEDADHKMKTCRLMSDWSGFDPEPEEYRHFRESRLAIVMPWAGSDGGGFATKAEFGCIEHTTSYEERPNG